MADRLLTVMVTEYNGYVFPTDDIETTLYRVAPMYDPSGRTVTFCEFTLGLKWLLKDYEATDGQVQDLVRKLTVPAGELLYEGRGLAFPSVNMGRAKDVAWGPKPGPVVLRPVGAGRATEAEWQVTWRVPVCGDAAYDGIAEWNFSVSFVMDADGVTTRTTRGHVTIANNRSAAGDKRVRRSADQWRENVVPPLLPGFKREGQSYDLSPDKSTLSYEVVDRELGGNTPGPGLLSAEASEYLVNERPYNGMSWVRTLRGSYTVAPGRTAAHAWRRFWATYDDRVAAIRSGIPRPVKVLPITFTAEDPDLYGPRQRVHLSITFKVAEATLPEILGAGGMWRPVPGSSWRAWVADLNGPDPNPFGPRGSAGLQFHVGEDALVDLCRADKLTQVSAPGGGTGSLLGAVAAAGSAVLAGLLDPNRFPAPTPDASWLHYEVFCRVVLDTGAVVVKTLPERPLEPAAVGNGVWDVLRSGLPRAVRAAVPAVVQPNPQQPVPDTVIQHRTTPTAHVYLTGRAARYGFDVPHPQLVSVGGRPATLVTAGAPGEGFVSGVVSHFVHPIYAAQWHLHYVVPGLAETAAPPNPLLGTETWTLRTTGT